MATCKNIQKRLSSFLDESLAEQQRAKVLDHLEHCTVCESHFGELRKNNLLLTQHYGDYKKAASDHKIKKFDDVMQAVYGTPAPVPEKKPALAASKVRKLVQHAKMVLEGFQKQHDEYAFSVDASGNATHSIAARLIPAILAGLGTLLLLAPELNSFPTYLAIIKTII